MTVGSYQQHCEEKFASFPAMVNCLNQDVKRDPRFNISRDSDLAKLYLVYANNLSEQVQEGKISENNARLLLAETYSKLKSQSFARDTALVASMQQNTNYYYPSYQSSGVVESYIDGTFEGWNGDTIFKLDNGQIWQQSSYSYYYYYAYHPKVLIYPANGCYNLKVDNVDQSICVKRLR